MSRKTKKKAMARVSEEEQRHRTILAGDRMRREVTTLGELAEDSRLRNKVNDTVSLEVHVSNDYSIVKPDWEWNRPVDTASSNFRNLLDSMKREGFRRNEPIVVNAEGWITSGNHRYHAAKKLRIPFCYIRSDSINPGNIIEKSNQGKNWLLEETFNIWLKHGKKDYANVERIRAKYSLPLRTALCLSLGRTSLGGANSIRIRNGELYVDPVVYQHADRRAQMLYDIVRRPIFLKNKWDSLSYLHIAVLMLISQEGYDHSRMMKCLNGGNVGNIEKVSTSDRWLEQLLALYNRSLSDKRKLRINTKKLGRW